VERLNRAGDQRPMPRRLWGTTNPSHPWLTAVVVVAMIVGFIAAMYLTFRAIADDHAPIPRLRSTTTR
jgi:hypothetical protein